MIATGFGKHLGEWLGLVLFIAVAAGVLASAWKTYFAPQPSQADRDVDDLVGRR